MRRRRSRSTLFPTRRSSDLGTNIKGVVGSQQDPETKAAQWHWATQWSLPKLESLSLVVPGLFGYRLDTPDRKSTRLNSSHMSISYAVFCLKKKKSAASL